MPLNENHQSSKARSNGFIAAGAGLLVMSMVGMSFAAVPLYQMFCQVTGYGGTTQRAEGPSGRILDREITVRFDANVAGVPWDFQPNKRSVTMKIGQSVEAHYTAKSSASFTTEGTATFNVTPELAGAYFNKIECFCFTQTTLKPGETSDMPVIFYIDPDIVDVPELENIKTITLSYTFFPPKDEIKPVASLNRDSAIQTN